MVQTRPPTRSAFSVPRLRRQSEYLRVGKLDLYLR